MKGLFKKFVAAATAVCVCSGMVMPMKGSADGVLIGDVNNDGDVTLSDLTHLNRYLAGQVELVNYVSADVNQNCVVDTVDAQIILQHLTDIIPSLPYIGYGGGSSYASVGAAAINTLKGYTIFDATDGKMVGSYYLDSNPLSTNSRGVVGTDTRYGDNSLSGVVKIILKNQYSGEYGFATGFVVDEHTIATAAHCVFHKNMGTLNDSKIKIEKILVLNNVGNVAQVLTGAYDVHVPNAYVTYKDYADKRNRAYDYAMITVSESLTSYANFNLGIMTDGMMSDSETIYCTGFPEKVYNTVNGVMEHSTVNNIYDMHEKYTGAGTVMADDEVVLVDVAPPPERTFYNNIDVGEGNSGGPVYVETEIGNTTYRTVIGILTGGSNNDGSEDGYNIATQMTTELLHFYKNNPNIAWE